MVRRPLLLSLLLLAPLAALAQDTGRILGTVTNAENKKPVADVVVTAQSPALPSEQIVVTDAKGQYTVENLPPGTYTLRFEGPQYRPFSRAGVRVAAGQPVRFDVQLAPDELQEEVIVTGARIPGPGLLERLGAALLGGGGQYEPPLPKSAPGLTGEAARLPQGGPVPLDMYFEGYGVNPTLDTEEEPVSTFSIDVDTASYALTRAYLERGLLPDEQAVRVEEFVNTFRPGDAPPTDGAPLAVHVEGFASPVRQGYHVLRVGLRARDVAPGARKPAHLVFVVDVSGSMDMENRLGLVKGALRLLLEQLDGRDLVSLVVYGTDARLLLEAVPASARGLLLQGIDSLRSEGSTNAQAGLELGYAVAARNLVPGGTNRVVLCSDGVANNGLTEADALWGRVRAHAAAGVTLSTVGFGMGNYNDTLMEQLAQRGQGNYAYVDGLEEARRVFVENLAGTLEVVARDVKVQVEFDPSVVSRYRLLGYENRLLAAEEFHDDAVDAGELGAGHAVTALYEVKLRPGVRADRLGMLRVRHKAPEGGASLLEEHPLRADRLVPAFRHVSSGARLAYVAAAFAEKLRGSYWVRPLSWEQLRELWEGVEGFTRLRPEVRELGLLIARAHQLDRRADRFEELAPVRHMDFDAPPRAR
jgi:Ca-activated chloride channel family protein